jgi:biopolymer transport protein ExbB
MPTNPAQPTIGFAHFIAQSDTVGKLLLVILLLMSVITWFVIANRFIASRGAKKAMNEALDSMKSVTSSQGLSAVGAGSGPFQRLANQAIDAAAQRQQQASDSGLSDSEFLTRSMRNCIEEETTKMETGLATLASIASSAPFVGLFGTVWGVYNALINIGVSGQGTLDKVAGPVGEALIMTGLGLAVAIPAALAYNAFVRRNRLVLTKLNSFAHDVFALLIRAK